MAASNEVDKLPEAYPMKSGDDPGSYANNSTLQRRVADAASELLNRTIAENLDVEMFSSSKTFHIADLGCSVGPNTFYSVDNILEAVELKYQGQGLNSRIPEFQVFFNDHTGNDFNMLFKSLPQNRRYYAAAVPGSFYGRILPKASLHFVHSSYTLHWLSRVPREVADKNSPAWNKGRIDYSNSTEEVVRAYKAQYAEDMECFLSARAQEIVYGGLMVLIILGRPNGSPHSQTSVNVMYETLGSLLMDMARKGVVSEEKVDSFNLPMYHMSPQELETAVERNGSFSIEKMELLPTIVEPDSVITNFSHRVASTIRAVIDGPFKQHFEGDILDELFDLFRKKLEDEPSIIAVGNPVNFLGVLKRKEN